MRLSLRRFITREWSVIAPVPEQSPKDRDRVGDFVRRALPRRLEAIGCTWPLKVEWDELHIGAWIVRGELVIRTWNSKRPWWYPACRPKAVDITDSFARVLGVHFERFRDADETGRRVATVWKYRGGGYTFTEEPGTEPLQVELAPGVYFDTNAGTSGSLIFRYQAGGGVAWKNALELGWVRECK